MVEITHAKSHRATPGQRTPSTVLAVSRPRGVSPSQTGCRQGSRGSPRGGDPGAGGSRANARSPRRREWPNCKRSRNSRTRSPRHAPALQPGDRVVVPRLGYDRPGRLVKLDPRKKSAVVAIGHVTWNVAIDELIPQAIRMPPCTIHRPTPKNSAAKRAIVARSGDDESPTQRRPVAAPYQETVGAFKNKTPSGGTRIERWNGRPACCSGTPQAPPWLPTFDPP